MRNLQSRFYGQNGQYLKKRLALAAERPVVIGNRTRDRRKMRPGYLHGPFSRLLRQLSQFFDLISRHPDPDVAADQPDGRRYDALPEEKICFEEVLVVH